MAGWRRRAIAALAADPDLRRSIEDPRKGIDSLFAALRERERMTHGVDDYTTLVTLQKIYCFAKWCSHQYEDVKAAGTTFYEHITKDDGDCLKVLIAYRALAGEQ